ncbi:AprI/Inh family metalloprotease inhibitor [Microvirga alba]
MARTPRSVAKPVPQPSAKGVTSFIGNWKIRDASGGSCRVQLSSVSTLDLYKASTVRCKEKTLQDINSWNVRDGDIVLYSRGSIVARLVRNGSTFEGKADGLSAPIVLSR